MAGAMHKIAKVEEDAPWLIPPVPSDYYRLRRQWQSDWACNPNERSFAPDSSAPTSSIVSAPNPLRPQLAFG